MTETSQQVESSIRDLLNDYLRNPLRFMREVGQQVYLRELILAKLNPNECSVKLLDHGKDKPVPVPIWKLQRVQLEAKVEAIKGSADDRSDLVVLRPGQPIQLTRFPNGALDIVARVNPEDVECVIEIKTACSADKSQRHLFRKDIDKLWRLVPSAPFDRHFVLIDRSLALAHVPKMPERRTKYPPDAVDHWHTELPAEFKCWTDKVRSECWDDSPKPRLLKDTIPRPSRCVTVWDLSAETGELAPRRRWAIFE